MLPASYYYNNFVINLNDVSESPFTTHILLIYLFSLSLLD